jgi:hypothetical protein
MLLWARPIFHRAAPLLMHALRPTAAYLHRTRAIAGHLELRAPHFQTPTSSPHGRSTGPPPPPALPHSSSPLYFDREAVGAPPQIFLPPGSFIRARFFEQLLLTPLRPVVRYSVAERRLHR